MLGWLSAEAEAALISFIDERLDEKLATETQPTPPSPWLTVSEAAEFLRTSPGAIYKRIERRQLLSYRPEGSPILLRREDLIRTGPQRSSVL